ncbi:MAG: hypothetical protein FIA99_02275 [Ruminiclostridium sp.]|nr:hypothetical protein [Ruminiclostridium sp.]
MKQYRMDAFRHIKGIWMSREKNLLKNTAIFMIGNFSSRFMGFLLLPLFTHYLTKSDLGYYDLVFVTVAIIIPVITLQINDAMYRYLLDTDSDVDAGRIITSSFTVTVAGLAACCVLFAVALRFMNIPFSYPILFYLITLVLSGLWQQVARGLKRNVAYSVSGIIFTAVTLISNIVLILFMDMKLEALFYSNIAASVSTVVYIELNIHILRKLNWSDRKPKLVKKLAAYSAPLLPNALNWWVVSTCNRYIINYFLGNDANGIFAVSTKFPSLLMAFNSVFYLAWQESAIEEYESKDKNEFYTRMFNFYMKFQFCSMLVLLPVTRWGMTLIVDKSFIDAWRYVPFLYAGTVFMAFSTFYGTGYLSSKDTRGAFTTSVAGAGANVLLNLVLTPVMGIQAAALSSMLAFAGMWILRIFQTRKYFSIRIDLRSLFALMTLSGIYMVFYYFNNLIIDVILAIVSIGVFYLFNRSLVVKAAGYIKNMLASNSFKIRRAEGE